MARVIKAIRSMVYRNAKPAELAGQRALVRQDPQNPKHWLCQFDKIDLEVNGINLAHGWHSFPKHQFKYYQARTH